MTPMRKKTKNRTMRKSFPKIDKPKTFITDQKSKDNTNNFMKKK